jgi:hypothetical protein
VCGNIRAAPATAASCCCYRSVSNATAETVENAKTRYFDSGEAFSGVSRKEDPLASEDDTQGPLACVKGQ